MDESDEKTSMQLEEMKYLSMRHLMQLSHERLEQLLYHADKELFQAQLTRDWLDTAIQFRMWNDAKSELKNTEVSDD